MTRFKYLRTVAAGRFLWEASPLTGKTHQIRAHAAPLGIPIRGDEIIRRKPRVAGLFARVGAGFQRGGGWREAFSGRGRL